MIRHLKQTLLGASLLSGLAVPAIAADFSPEQTMPLTIVGKPDAASKMSVEVALPLRNVEGLKSLLSALHDPKSPQYHHWLTPAEFGLRFGPDSATVAKVTKALQARGFAVAAHTRSLHLVGSASLVEATFGTHLQVALSKTAGGGKRVIASSALRLPAELAGATVVSFGRQEMHVMSQRVTGPLHVDNRYGPDGGYWYDDLRQAYQYPAVTATVKGTTQPLDGTGATIGVLMSSDYLPSDLQAMFDHEHYSTTTGKPDPTLYADIPVNGGGGLFGGAFGEVEIDTQSELGGAPGAHVVLYDIPDLSDGNIFAGYVTAIEQNQVDVLSASFGGCELEYFPKYNGGTDYRGVLKAYDELFMQGNSQGITFLASSGDSAGKECPNTVYSPSAPGKFIASVGEPASDPNVTAVGGTNLQTVYLPGSLNSAYAGENAWSDPEIPYDVYGLGQNVSGGVWGAGGGVSAMWPAPSYQSMVTTGSTMRTVPDVGMQVGGCPGGISILSPKIDTCNGNNNPNDGDGSTDRSYGVYAYGVGLQGGGFYGFIGTSLSSPEFASAVALLVEQQGRMGNLNPYLYAKAAAQAKSGKVAQYFHTNIPGYNGVIQSNVSATYNISTGVGTPIVKALVGETSAPSAGLPRTISNP